MWKKSWTLTKRNKDKFIVYWTWDALIVLIKASFSGSYSVACETPLVKLCCKDNGF